MAFQLSLHGFLQVRPRGGDQLLEAVQQASFVFFTRTGDGGVERRCTMRLALSWMIHSTVSPLVNSMAWATAEGKLMYHCWLCRRWMSWTLVENSTDIWGHNRYHVFSAIVRTHPRRNVTFPVVRDERPVGVASRPCGAHRNRQRQQFNRNRQSNYTLDGAPVGGYRLRTAQAAGVSSGSLRMLVSARPGRTAAR